MKKLVIIPTYNERENVSRMISKVMSLFGGYDLLIVDDGSPDGTAAIVRGRQEEFPGRVHLIERSGKLGLGTAYIAGFRWALAHGYDLVYEMDCDFSHNPDDLERLTAAVTGGADVAVGVALFARRERGQLADVAAADVLLCLEIRADRHPYACVRRHGGGSSAGRAACWRRSTSTPYAWWATGFRWR